MVAKFHNHTNTMRTANDTPRIPVHAAQMTVDYRPEVFLYHAKQCIFFEIKIITRDIMFYENKTIDRTSYSYRQRLYVNTHVNQP